MVQKSANINSSKNSNRFASHAYLLRTRQNIISITQQTQVRIRVYSQQRLLLLLKVTAAASPGSTDSSMTRRCRSGRR
jgi:CYTH domain-containing protein